MDKQKVIAHSAFWLIVIVFGGLFLYSGLLSESLKEVPISDVVARANEGKIKQIEIQGNDVRVTPKGENKPTERSVKEAGTIYEQGLEQGKTNFRLITTDFQNIFVGPNSSPVIYDFDKDGLLDFIIGESNNSLNFYKNKGI